MEEEINNIYDTQINLLSEYLKSSNQPYDSSQVSFMVNLVSQKENVERLEYQISYLDYSVCGLLLMENKKIQTELCREIHLGKTKITVTRHDRHEEYQTSAYVSIQHLKFLWVERFNIWFEDGLWLPLVVTPEELRSYKIDREKEKVFRK